MSFAPKSIAASDGLVVDTNMRLTASECAGLKAAGVAVVIRYVFFGAARGGDISPEELQAITGAGMTLLLVQHPRLPKDNILNATTGHADAEWAVRNAIAAGYDPAQAGGKLHLALDMEGVVSGGSLHAPAWTADVAAAGFAPLVYCGYASGLTSSECDALPGDPEFWCDAAPLSVRPAPTKRYALHQEPQTTIAGVGVDKNAVLKDGVLFGLALAAEVVETDPAAGSATDPAADPAADTIPIPSFAHRDSAPPDPDATHQP